MIDTCLAALIDRGERTHRLTEVELTMLLAAPEAEEALAAAADRVRARTVGNDVHLRGQLPDRKSVV